MPICFFLYVQEQGNEDRMMITLRQKKITDEKFLLQLYESTRAQELVPWRDEERNAFVQMQYTAQSIHYRNTYPDLNYQIILSDGQSIGRLLTARLEDELRIVDISLLPEFHNKGISTNLITQVLKEAEQEGTCVRLHVAVNNPAKQLYERLGFRKIQSDGVYIYMEARSEIVAVK